MDKAIRKQFEVALQTGSLLLTPNKIFTVKDSGIPFEIRLAESLGNKPKSNLKKEAFNPFLPPDPNLLVQSLKEHNIVLNKYCIQKYHTLITTQTFESQFSPLGHKDFSIALELLNQVNGNLLFFYNCGSNSGASVLHKHIQMLICDQNIPIDSIVKERTTSDIIMLSQYPFVHSCVHLGTETGISMKEKLDQLLLHSLKQLGLHSTCVHVPVDTKEEPKDFVSYNLCFTKDWMMVVPRKKESFDGISINSVGYAGMLLAKSTTDFEYLKEKGPLSILKELAFTN